MDDLPSTRPYLIRAVHEWCIDYGYTPYIVVAVDESVQVPREYVRDNEIVLNASGTATSNLTLGNEYIEFKARFGGVVREIMVPVGRVLAVYARENGQGMSFVEPDLQASGAQSPAAAKPASALPKLQLVPAPTQTEVATDPPPPPARPSSGSGLKRVK